MRHLVVATALVAACGNKHPRQDDPVVPPKTADAGPKPADAAVPDAAVARSEHAVFDLVDNRHASHRRVDGDLVIDASDVGFARYTRFSLPVSRWRLGQTVDGQRAAVADRLASIEVPLTVDQAPAATQLTASVHGDAGQILGIKINGRRASKDASVKLEAGWQTITVEIEKDRMAVGENQIAFETSGGRNDVAFAWIRLGPPREPLADPRIAATFDGAADSFELTRGGSVTWYVTLPDGANLVADKVVVGCHVDVQARAGDDSFAGGQLSDTVDRIDLGPMAGKVVRLIVALRDCPKARVSHARVTIVGPAPQALPKAAPPKYVILWVMDALRADRIPIFTPGARAQVPNLEELAKSSAIFRHYYVQGNESQVSHSSMWTGLYPAVHNVRDNDMSPNGGTWMLDKKFDLIATKLQDAGYFTTGVTGNGFVNEDAGYARGFKEYRNMMRETGVLNNLIYGEKIVDAALKQLDSHRSGPTYLFLGTIDTHSPWVARKPWIDTYSPGPYNGPFTEYGTADALGLSSTSMGCSKIPPPVDIERLRAIYDSAISYHDKMVGKLVEQLKSWGVWDQTMLIITADHGDELFEDGRCGHGGSLRDSLERVPFLIHDPARFPEGTVVEEGAECVDILPTIMDAVGAKQPAAEQGDLLEPLAQGIGRGWVRPSYASMYEQSHAMRIGRWKVRVAWNGVPLVNDMVDDPAEMKDVTTARPVERRMLTDNLGMFLALRKVWKKSQWGVTTNVTPAGAAALDALSL